MKISKYLNINRIEIIVTASCTGRCKHCSFIDRVEGKALDGHYSVIKEKAEELIEKLSKYFKIDSVMTFGGEPLLYPETVAAIHSKACRCGIKKRQIITNGYFTNKEKRAEEVASMLKEAGVNDLLLSVDAFHQEKIPLEKVKVFMNALKEKEINTRLSPAWVVNKSFKNDYNCKTKAILKELSEFNFPEGEGNNIFLSGNAVKYLSEFYEKKELDLNSKCGGMPYTDKLTNITSLSLEPNGDLIACAFKIGNIYKESIEDILSRYDPYENRLMRVLTDGCAADLLSYIAENRIDIDISGAQNICDICRKLNKYCDLK